MTADSSPSRRDRIFISYRRDDARGASGRLYDWLRIAFGRDRIFRDVQSIGVGKWRDKVDAALARSAVCVAVIGPRWANADNLPRLLDSDDIVRRELVTALDTAAVTVVPALVEGIQRNDLPLDKLPTELRRLFSEWNVREVTEGGWEDDLRRLIAEIADASGLAVGPDLDTLLRQAAEAQQRVIELEDLRDLQSDHIDALRRTIDDLRRRLAEAPAAERPGFAAAFAALAQGDSRIAEDAFEREYDAQIRAAGEARQTMAEAARNVANLALLRDIAKAASFYRKALAADPDDADTARLLGHALLLLGDVRGAEAALSQSLNLAAARRDSEGQVAAQIGLGIVFQASKNLATAEQAFATARSLAETWLGEDSACCEAQRGLAVILDRIGDVRNAQGDRVGALKAFREALAISEALAARDSSNTEAQRDLSVSYTKIGDMQLAHGDGSGALATYRSGLAIHEALVARDPGNPQWRRDLSVSHDRIGNVLIAQGDETGGLAVRRKALAISEALAAGDPANTEWQRHVALYHGKLGDVLFEQGGAAEALAAYGRGLAVAQALSELDPANTDWQRDVAGFEDRIGDVLLLVHRDTQSAVTRYRRALMIREALLALDPTHTERQRDLAGCQDRIGDVLLRSRGGEPEALAAYRKGLSMREALTARDPANIEWQRDLSVSHNKIGNALVAQGDLRAAIASYRNGLTIRAALAARDPSNVERQRDLVVSHNKIGEVLEQQGDRAGALVAYRKALAIREVFAEHDPTNARRLTEVAISCGILGTIREGQSAEARKELLLRGRDILLSLSFAARSAEDQERIDWFNEQIAALPRGPV